MAMTQSEKSPKAKGMLKIYIKRLRSNVKEKWEHNYKLINSTVIYIFDIHQINYMCNLDLNLGKDYSGAKFLYSEPISLNKAHSTK